MERLWFDFIVEFGKFKWWFANKRKAAIRRHCAVRIELNRLNGFDWFEVSSGAELRNITEQQQMEYGFLGENLRKIIMRVWNVNFFNNNLNLLDFILKLNFFDQKIRNSLQSKIQIPLLKRVKNYQKIQNIYILN